MQNHALYRLIVGTVVLSLAHTLDHAARGDFNPAVNPDAYASILVSAVIYLIAGVGLVLHRNGRIGAGAWTVAGIVATGFAAFAHLNPGTAQPLGYIFAAYATPIAGWLAVGIFIVLFAALVSTTAYAAYLATYTSRN